MIRTVLLVPNLERGIFQNDLIKVRVTGVLNYLINRRVDYGR